MPTAPIGAISAIDEAKAVVRSHEAFLRVADLDGLMSNVADDVVVLNADTPLIKGKVAFRDFAASLLQIGGVDLGHDYEGAEVVGDAVVLHGVARGTLTPATGQATRFANNFIDILKRQPDGKFRLWRIAFASSGAAV